MGMARQATGDMDKAVKNYTRAAELNPNYAPPREALEQLGINVP
jgi:hypothetical protein